MLLCIFLGVSAALGVGGWLMYDKLWLLPVGFVGGFLSLTILFGLMILVMGALVDMEKPQEKDSPFYRWVVHELIIMALPVLGVRYHVSGLEKLPEGKCLVVCNHLFDLDPAFLLKAMRKKKLAFISKREVDGFFLIGKFLHKIMGQPINRENDREALKTILSCIQLLKEQDHSIAVFPEGYIKPDRLLRPFRSGVFKIAQRAKVPVVVCTLRNTQHIVHNFLRLKKTDVYLDILSVIGVEEWEGATTVDIGNKAYEIMAANLGPGLVWQECDTNS